MWNKFRHWLTVGLLISQSMTAQEQGLKRSDVYQVMQGIFQQHLGQQGVSKPFLKHAFTAYIDQFDPFHRYLLESEVAPYLSPTDEQISQFLTQYRNNDLSAFVNLNQVIQKSIERARAFRNSLFQDRSKLLEEASIMQVPDRILPFATTSEELKARIKREILTFIHLEMLREGKEKLLEDPTPALTRYEALARSREAPYMGTDVKGAPLPAIEQENIFATNVLKALTSSLDAHSNFLDNQEAFDLRLHLEKEYRGIGIEIRKKGENILVNRLIEQGPAAKSGKVQVQDKIVKVDGHDVAGESLEQVLSWLRDTSDPVVELVLVRKVGNQDQTITVQLLQEEIDVDEGRVETSYKKIEGGVIGRIVLHSFYKSDDGISSVNDVRDALKKLEKAGPIKGLILDLRDNTGGFLIEAVKVASLFISSGIVVISKYANGEEQVYRDVDGKSVYEGPLVVLTSRETASAAEIVTQALQDYGLALVVGDVHTYGKGTIQMQTVTESNGGSQQPHFKVTVGKYYTVSGKTPQGTGVSADILVPSPLSEMAIGEQFLDNAESSDLIADQYKDSFKDVKPARQEWYQRHYSPVLQKKVEKWRLMIPKLKERSAKRIAQNAAYQHVLRRMRYERLTQLPSFEGDVGTLQLQEAYQIVADMIALDHN